MTLYTFVLILHVTAVFVLAAALTIEVLSLLHLRGASTAAEAYPWVNPVPKLPVFAIGSLVVILSSAMYLIIPLATSGRAWPKVAVAALFLMGPFGALSARRMRAIRQAFRVKNAMLLGRLRDPFLKVSLAVRVTSFFGIFLLVSAKPGLWESIGLIGASVVVGFVLSLLPWRRSASLPAASVDFGDN